MSHLLSLREASKLFSVSRATLSKALESGAITGSKNDSGHWRIDPAEMARVYKPRLAKAIKPRPDRPDQPDHVIRSDPAQNPDLEIRLARAEAALEAEKEKTAILERHLSDLRSMLPAPDKAAQVSWWPWLKAKIRR